MTERIREINRDLKLRRKALTQVVIAKRLGISQPRLNMILKGKRPCPEHLVSKFNRIFNK